MEWRTGITKRHWPYYENGTHEPKVLLAQRMAAAFNDIAAEKDIELKKLSVEDLYPPQ
jgi:DNA-binding XRE family transcriptional regulator